jgi:hypothetical protein
MRKGQNRTKTSESVPSDSLDDRDIECRSSPTTMPNLLQTTDLRRVIHPRTDAARAGGSDAEFLF